MILSIMKLIAIFVLVGLSVAIAEESLVQKCAPLIEKVESVPNRLENLRGQVPLRVVLGHPEAKELDALESQIRFIFGQHIGTVLKQVIKDLQQLGDEAKDKFFNLTHVFEKHPDAENALEFLKSVLELDGEKENIEQLLTQFFNNDEQESALALYYQPNTKVITDIWEKLVAWFTGLGTMISDKFDVFKEWAKGIYITSINAAKPILDQIKELASDFLKNNWETLSTKIVKQALSFFHPYAGVLGEKLVQQFIKLAKEKGLFDLWSDVTTASYY